MYYAALAVFMIVVAGDVAGLLLDGWLLRAGMATITHRVQSGDILLGVALVAWQLVGALSLGLHFLARA